MIKIFEEDALDFTTLGIGVLSDALTTKVTDERNGSYEFEFTYPTTGNLYNEIQLKRIVVAKANIKDKGQPFRIYLISEPIDGKVTINARHISYDLSNYIVEPFEAKNPYEVFVGIQNGLRYLNVQCPFTFISNYDVNEWEQAIEDAKDDSKPETIMKVTTPTSVRSILGGDGGLIATFEGDLEFDGLTVKYYCKDKPRGSETGFEIRYGSNMTSMEHKREQLTNYTAIYPYYARKTTESTSEENSSYRPVYIVKGATDATKFTRNWLSFENGGTAFNPEKELVSASSPISSAIQVKTEGEYKDKLYVYISEKLLNTQGSVSNGVIGKIIDTVKNAIRVFNFVEVDWTKETYIPNNYYYTEDTIDEEHPIELCKFILDTSTEKVEGRTYYNAILKGTTDVLAGHYYPIPLYAYVSRLHEDVQPATAGVEINEDPNNKDTWLSYDVDGDPVSWNTTNIYMRMIPLQIQNGNAAGKMVIYDPYNKKYKELKSGIEKTYSTSETTSEEKVELFKLKLYNDIQMDSDKLKNGNLYFYSAPSYEVTTVTSETYKPNEYYYISSTTYVIAKVTASTFKAGVYYKLNNDTKQYELVDTFDGTVLYYKKDIIAIDSSDSYTEGRIYYKQNNVYIPVFKSLDPSGFTYEANKYYYVDNDTIYEEDYHFTLDTNESPTEGRTYYELLVCKEIEEPVHENNFTTLVTNKGYELNTVGTPRFELVTYTTYQSGKKYYACNMTDSEPPVKSSDQYIDTVNYFRICPSAPIIYLDEDSRTKHDDSKVLSVDLTSNIDGDPTADALLEAAFKYIEENQKTGEFNKVDDNLETSFVRLSDTLGYEFIGDLETIQNGDIVKVVNVSSGLEVKLKVTSIQFDPINETYSDIELGSKPEDITETVLTSGSDISSLKNTEGYVNRAEVQKIVADTIDAKNLTITGLMQAARAQIQEMVVNTLSVTDLDASHIVTGSLGATTVSVKSSIQIEGYTFIEEIVDFDSYVAYIEAHPSQKLYYKASQYSSDYIENNEPYVYERSYYYKEGTVFSVDNTGKLTANSVDVAGKITATSGIIGDCQIVTEGGRTILKVPAANIQELSTSVINAVRGLIITTFINEDDQGNTVYSLDNDTKGLVAYSKISGVSINQNGFRVQATVSGETFDAFYLTPQGNLTLKGSITATGGNIAGWTIDANKLSYSTIGSDGSTCLSPSGVSGWVAGVSKNNWGIAVGSRFGVTLNGELYASDVTLSGSITATSGTIGGCTIDVDKGLQVDKTHITSIEADLISGFSIALLDNTDPEDETKTYYALQTDFNSLDERVEDAEGELDDLDGVRDYAGITGVTINSEGFRVQKGTEDVFYLDKFGNLTITGNMNIVNGALRIGAKRNSSGSLTGEYICEINESGIAKNLTITNLNLDRITLTTEDGATQISTSLFFEPHNVVILNSTEVPEVGDERAMANIYFTIKANNYNDSNYYSGTCEFTSIQATFSFTSSKGVSFTISGKWTGSYTYDAASGKYVTIEMMLTAPNGITDFSTCTNISNLSYSGPVAYGFKMYGSADTNKKLTVRDTKTASLVGLKADEISAMSINGNVRHLVNSTGITYAQGLMITKSDSTVPGTYYSYRKLTPQSTYDNKCILVYNTVGIGTQQGGLKQTILIPKDFTILAAFGSLTSTSGGDANIGVTVWFENTPNPQFPAYKSVYIYNGNGVQIEVAYLIILQINN